MSPRSVCERAGIFRDCICFIFVVFLAKEFCQSSCHSYHLLEAANGVVVFFLQWTWERVKEMWKTKRIITISGKVLFIEAIQRSGVRKGGSMGRLKKNKKGKILKHFSYFLKKNTIFKVLSLLKNNIVHLRYYKNPFWTIYLIQYSEFSINIINSINFKDKTNIVNLRNGKKCIQMIQKYFIIHIWRI